ncbi:dipeptidase [Collinsella tanakaei]|uniref:dipeptidase n=1 Tax=Collinsella tanakaei TaxID=626935 RepID=UPI0026EE9A1D|nr:membrane dipeptidase [Collinsella tanakaei]
MFTVFDLHCDTADRLAWQSLPSDLKTASGMDFYGPGDENAPELCRDLKRNHCHISLEGIGDTPWAQCFACYIPDELSARQSFEFFQHVALHMDEQIALNGGRVGLATDGESISAILDSGRVAAVRTIENARFFALDPAYVDKAALGGVLMASLSWNAAGPLASGHDTAEGLTTAGFAALKRMEAKGMAIDVSHLNDRCFDEVASSTDAPLVASHSNSRAVCGAPRNLTDAQFDCIRERGGLVGLNFCCDFLRESGEPTFDDISRHIDRWLERDGEDAIALGSDFDGCDTPRCIASAADMPAFQNLLRARFGETITAKLCGLNALRFFSRRIPATL